MNQDEKWLEKYNEVKLFIETNHRNPSKYDPEERGKFYNRIHHNKKLLKARALKESRLGMFKELLSLIDDNRHINQYQ